MLEDSPIQIFKLLQRLFCFPCLCGIWYRFDFQEIFRSLFSKWKEIKISIFKISAISSDEIYDSFSTMASRVCTSKSEGQPERGSSFTLKITPTKSAKPVFDRPKNNRNKLFEYFCRSFAAYSFTKLMEHNMANFQLFGLHLWGFHLWTECQDSTKSN